MMGGRIAEELIFNQLTTGAANDLQQATDLARKMVCDWGMSEKLGPMHFGKREEMVFLGRDFNEQKDYSEQTAVDIDAEVKRIVTSNYERAKGVVAANIDKLKVLAEALLEYETLDGAEIDVLFSGKRLDRPPAIPPPTSAPRPTRSRRPRPPAPAAVPAARCPIPRRRRRATDRSPAPPRRARGGDGGVTPAWRRTDSPRPAPSRCTPRRPQLLAQRLTWVSTVRVSRSLDTPPHVVQQRGPRLHAVAPIEQQAQQPELERGERRLVALDPDPVGVAVDAQLAEVDAGRALGGAALLAAEDGGDAQGQLAHAEGLDHVVVGAQLEADHPVDLRALGGQHEDGGGAGGGVLLDGLADVGARHSRQHQIEDDEIGHPLAHLGERRLAVRGGGHVVAGLAEVVGQDLLEIGLVFDDQNERHERAR
jgi:hypothetical protein